MVYDIKSNSLVSWSQYLKENRCSSSLQLNLKKMMGLWNIVYICMHAFSSLLHPDVLHSRMKLLFSVGKSLLFRRYSLFFLFYFLIFSFTIRDVFHKSPESQSVRTSWKWQHFSRNIFSLWSQQVMREKVILCKMQKLKSWKTR